MESTNAAEASHELHSEPVASAPAPVDPPALNNVTQMPLTPHEVSSAVKEVSAEAVQMPVVAMHATVSAVNTGAEKLRTGMLTTQAKAKENMDKAMRTAQDLMSFSQGNFEAMIKSGQIWAAGVQELSKQVAATAQAHYDESLSVFKALTSVKSLKEAFDLQSGLARTSMEKAVSETGRFTDASLKLAEEAIAPLTARVTLAVETFSKSA
jgi:phasin family protein